MQKFFSVLIHNIYTCISRVTIGKITIKLVHSNANMNLDINQITNNLVAGTLSNVLSGIVLSLLTLLVLKILRPWIYKILNPYLSNLIQFFLKGLEFVFNPWLRILLISYLVWLVNYNNSNMAYSVLIIITSITLLWKPKFQTNDNPASEIYDGFDELKNKTWFIKTGTPVIENNFGKPPPGLSLTVATPVQATNTFLILKNLDLDKGAIECDFNLEHGAVFNVVFFCDTNNDNWYMARYDSRLPDSSDGILIKNQGKGVNWQFYKMSGTHTSEKQWHRARVEFSSEKVSMYRDGELIIELINPIIFGKSVGFFNEVESVHVDNFYISR